MAAPSAEDLRRAKRFELTETVIALAYRHRIFSIYHPIRTDNLVRDVLHIHDIPTLESIIDALFWLVELNSTPPPWESADNQKHGGD
jgi:hypothetical protein